MRRADMRPKTETRGTAEQTVKDIRRATRKHHAAEEKIRIVLEDLRGWSEPLTRSSFLWSSAS